MMVAWDRFYRHVQPHVPGCPEIVIEQHLQEAAADFCARSEVWRYQIEPDYTVAGVADYFLDVPTGALLENITALFVDGFPVKRVSDSDFAQDPGAPQSAPTRYSIIQDRQIRFYDTPDRSYEFRGYGVLKPTLSATGIEDFIFETHGRAIACGAIASLTIIPGKEWTNPDLANYYKAKFLKQSDDAKGRDVRRANMRIRSVNFA